MNFILNLNVTVFVINELELFVRVVFLDEPSVTNLRPLCRSLGSLQCIFTFTT